MPTIAPNPLYTIVGQFEDANLDYTAEGLTRYQSTGSYWALQYDGNYYFRVWNGATQAFLVELTMDNPEESWGEYADLRAANLDPAYIHVAVVRNGSLLRLFVKGKYISLSWTAECSVADWNEIHKAMTVNGQGGWVCNEVVSGGTNNGGKIPYSTTRLEALRITDSALYWDEFTPENRSFYQQAGLCFYPRMFPILMNGAAGDMRGNFSFMPRISGTMGSYKAGTFRPVANEDDGDRTPSGFVNSNVM